MQIACVVEGEGEDGALPVLLRRIIAEIDPSLFVQVLRPFRQPKDRLKKQDHLIRAVESAARRLTSPGAVLVVLDADEDCPAQLGPKLLSWAQAAHGHTPIAVVLAMREYEAWFLAAAESLRGHRGLPGNLDSPAEPEAISGAKEWLTRRMPGAQRYSPTRHQASFSATSDLDLARRRAPSFEKLCRDVRRLVEALRPLQG